MSKRRVIVVGAGALGSHFVQFMRSVDVDMVAIDFDHVERKNVLAQFCSKSHVGKPKTMALAQLMDFLYGKKILGVPHRLDGNNVGELLRGADLVVDALDNYASRWTVQQGIRGMKLPGLHGALAADGNFGRVVWDEKFEPEDSGAAGKPTCEGGEHLPFIALVSAYLARAAQEFLTSGRKVGYEVSPAGAHAT